ncbi:virulence factor SrfC family protein [Yersinia ruckeri]|uniref:putative virulence factor n=1 Tax=Yersinia ruckeri TaxID=29486 RepID=UPI00223861C8|nr:virulence factor SrfC family protein [Yersinia ruckeri]EKN4698101.1 virulence factor [Yersinia ruckeri]MCW6563510.1 virulence factor SrfC family protein [Yersinia ruckeri]MCW6576345.1 virulence factor SrfC family protein [Yersinia ruckeri]MCW6584989.1 virulence factor SrfC family protein [Yersinia ruckeri]MCW6599743.1 virulence factor SrfC family protein [Yersinia ruckeri]
MKSLTPEQLSASLTQQLHSVAQGIDHSLEWIDNCRHQAPRLDTEAEGLKLKLRRHRSKARRLAETSATGMTIGFFGQSHQGKSALITALATDGEPKLATRLGTKTYDYLTHINPDNQASALATRFTRQYDPVDAAYPVQLTLLSETDIARMTANIFLHDFSQVKGLYQPDMTYIDEHLHLLTMHRQAQPVAGMTADDVVTLWDYLLRHDHKGQALLNSHFWPTAVELAPFLNVDDRARLWSLLWGELPELTHAYQHFSQTLQHVNNATEILAPISVLVDDLQLPANSLMNMTTLTSLHTPVDASVQVRPILQGKVQTTVTLSLAELTLLSAELRIPLLSAPRDKAFASVDLLELPAWGALLDTPMLGEAEHGESYSLAQHFLRAKSEYLLDRYTDQQGINLLLVCRATDSRAEVSKVAKSLDYWVKQTQGENAEVRSRRHPGLIWALTPFDRRVIQHPHYDEAVQRQVGNPGDSWGLVQAIDERATERMATYLIGEIQRNIKSERLTEQLHDIQRELQDNLLGHWAESENLSNPQAKQRIAESLIKTLQTRTGVHGELLERLLPTREELQRLFLRQQVQTVEATRSDAHPAATHVEPFSVGIEMDLFSELQTDSQDIMPAPLPRSEHPDNHYARRLHHYWINHLRSLPENAPLVALLGVSKPILELLMEELATASIRLDIEGTLQRKLADNEQSGILREQLADQQVSRALTVLGDFVAWLGFLQVEEGLRPASRINRGHKIFAPPEKPAENWGSAQRLTRLALTPTNTTAFYIYDWLVGLNEMIMHNVGYSAASELSVAQRNKLAAILALIKPMTR